MAPADSAPPRACRGVLLPVPWAAGWGSAGGLLSSPGDSGLPEAVFRADSGALRPGRVW